MQENKFIDRILHTDEIPMKRMQGFREPTDEEHEIILNRVIKNLRKETVSMFLYSVMCIAFAIMYVVMFFRSDNKNDYIMLAVAGFFALIIVINVYKFIKVDRYVKNIVEKKDYVLRNVRIKNLELGFGPQIGKSNARVTDESGNVYGYDFVLNRKMKKIYRKNENAEFTVLKFDEKRDMYSITYFEKENNCEKAQKVQE